MDDGRDCDDAHDASGCGESLPCVVGVGAGAPIVLCTAAIAPVHKMYLGVAALVLEQREHGAGGHLARRVLPGRGARAAPDRDVAGACLAC